MEAFTRWVIRNSVAIVALSVILSLVAGFFTIRLYGNLRTDLEELLPSHARSVQDLKQIGARLPSSTNLAILAFSDDVDASRRFMDDLAVELAKNKELVSRVEYRIDREIHFFENRKPLFIEVDDLKRIRDYVKARIDYESELHNPLNIFSEIEIPEPKFDLRELEAKYSKPVQNFLRFPGGYYASEDEKIRVLLVYITGEASEIGRANRLRSFIDETIARLNPKSYAPDLRVHYTGDVETLYEEHAALVADLKLSAVVVMVLVLAALLLFYRDVLGVAALLLSLLMGTAWTFALTYFVIGYLNANSAFLGSIVLGNGINFGIIALARYFENRRAGMSNSFAVVGASSTTFTATILAALAAGLSYGSLVLTPFRGFRQFGMIGFVGMIFCWIAAYTVQPALLIVFERLRTRLSRGHGHPIARRLEALDRRYFRQIAITSFVLAALSVYSILSYRGQIIETDITKLRDRRSMTQGSTYYSKFLDKIFGRYISPLVILPKTHEDSEKIRAGLREVMNRPGGKKMIASVYSEDDFVPKNQPEKIQVLREIENILPRRSLQALSDRDRKNMEELLRPEALRPFTDRDLPHSILDHFREKDGSLGKIVLVEPVLDPAIFNNGDNQTILMNQLRSVVDRVSPGTAIAGQLPLTVEMYHAVRTQGPKATATAFFAVVGLVILIFRNLKTIVLALTALLLGVLWFFGVIFAADFKINFLNFIAMPITFGIGVDYGVNIFQRYRLEGPGSIGRVVGNSGGAVALSSLTTMIGYGSLMVAGSQAFVSFGRVAILGEATCVTAALVSLPSFLMWIDRREQEKQVEATEETPKAA